MKLSKRAHQTIIVLLVFGGFIGLMFLSGLENVCISPLIEPLER